MPGSSREFADRTDGGIVETLARIRGALGWSEPRSAVTPGERDLICSAVAGANRVAELGVFEGATSAVLASSLPPSSVLYLVDPFTLELKVEKLLRISLKRATARRAVRRYLDRVEFVELRTAEAVALVPSNLDLVFVDADHSYPAVRSDFEAWSVKLAPRGRFIFHDSRRCPSRPDLSADSGPVRLLDEIEEGRFAGWSLAASAESAALVERSS
jgi:hypothetical protein